jgi:Ca2+-binding EF-hand superfamily protein
VDPAELLPMMERQAKIRGRMQAWQMDEKQRRQRQEPEPKPEMSTFEAYEIAKTLNLPPGHVTKAWQLFKQYDTDNRGKITASDYQLLLRAMLREQYPKARDIPRDLFKPVEDPKADVHFSQFLTWITQNAFSESILLSSAQRMVRAISRKFKKPCTEIEAIKQVFDSFDDNGNGMLDFGEFRELLRKLLRIRDETALPDSRVRSFWRELDTDSSGVIEFSEFIPWYLTYFDYQGFEKQGISPIYAFYRNLRPTATMGTRKA